MKNLLILGFALLVSPVTNASLLVYNGFSYPIGSALDQQTGWTVFNGTALTSDQIIAGSLSIPGFAISQGNSVELVTDGNGGITSFSTQTTDTWYSFMFNVDSTASLTTQNAVAGFVQSGTTVGGTIYIRTDGTGFDIGGQDNQSGPIQWNTNNGIGYPVGQNVLIVGECELNSGSAFNAWVFGNGIPSPTWGTNSPTGSTIQIGGGTPLSFITGFYFDSTVDIQVDELRVGTTYADVTPVPEPGSAALWLGLVVLAAGFFRRKTRFAHVGKIHSISP